MKPEMFKVRVESSADENLDEVDPSKQGRKDQGRFDDETDFDADIAQRTRNSEQCKMMLIGPSFELYRGLVVFIKEAAISVFSVFSVMRLQDSVLVGIKRLLEVTADKVRVTAAKYNLVLLVILVKYMLSSLGACDGLDGTERGYQGLELVAPQSDIPLRCKFRGVTEWYQRTGYSELVDLLPIKSKDLCMWYAWGRDAVINTVANVIINVSRLTYTYVILLAQISVDTMGSYMSIVLFASYRQCCDCAFFSHGFDLSSSGYVGDVLVTCGGLARDALPP
ncbi:hypothetical protein Tco_1554814 [Tanacetum coccineum]